MSIGIMFQQNFIVYFYLIAFIVLLVSFLILNGKINDKYYIKKFSGVNTYGTGGWFFLPILFPKKYFKKDKLTEALYVFVLSRLFALGAILSFIKFISFIN